MDRIRRHGSKALFAILLLAVTISLVAPPSNSLDTIGDDFDEGEPRKVNSVPDIDYPSLNFQEDMKEVPSGITGIDLIGSDNGKVFPNTPFTLRITFSSFSPETLTVILDSEEPEGKITHEMSSNTFTLSDELNGMVEIDLGLSRTTYNATRNEWETDIVLRFTWSATGEIPRTVQAELLTTNGSPYSMAKENAYVLEKDLELIGETLIDYESPEYVSPDNHVKGGSFIVIHGLSVVFQGSDSFYPDPKDIELGVTDTDGRVWEYYPEHRSDLEDIRFSFKLPRIDGPEIFTFSIFRAHHSSTVTGHGEYSCRIDSTPPNVGDPIIEHHDGETHFDLAIDEKGSGMDISTFEYTIIDDNGDLIVEWTGPDHPVIEDDRISFDVQGLDPGKFDLKVRVDDKVSNTRQKPRTFHFSTLPENYHDISLDPVIRMSMEPPIQGNLIHFTSFVFNNGDNDEKDLVAEITRNHEPFYRVSINHIPSGGSREINWEWEALGEATVFEVIIDPLDTIDDLSPDDNSASITLDPEYRDISARNDYLIPSDWNAKAGDVITLSFMLNNIGSISSEQFKVQVLEEGQFLGQYIISSMEPDSSRELRIDWIVNTHTSEIQLKIDPLNEVIETVEWNNIITLDNPFLEKSSPGDDGENEGSPEGGTDEDPGQVTEDEEGDKQEVIDDGGTTWSGPEADSENEIPALPMVPSDDQDPPMESSDPNLIPLIIPSAAITISLMILGGALLAFRFEPFRYRWALALIPLYSKLKRSNIEKGIRFEILGYLKARPGANYTELKKNLDLNDGTLVHHLRILEREDKIYSKKMGKYKLFYASSYKRQSAIDDYISPFHKRILEIISSNPGIVPKKLSVMLDRSQTDISYHLSELSRNGYLQKRKKGRNSHYYINSELIELMSA